jgi:hypothetical protein
MTISLTPEKVTHFLESEDKFRKGVHITIREVAKFVGTWITYSVAILQIRYCSRIVTQNLYMFVAKIT